LNPEIRAWGRNENPEGDASRDWKERGSEAIGPEDVRSPRQSSRDARWINRVKGEKDEARDEDQASYRDSNDACGTRGPHHERQEGARDQRSP
jgi:hypothetical protein